MLLNTQATVLGIESKMQIIHFVTLLGECQVKAHSYTMKIILNLCHKGWIQLLAFSLKCTGKADEVHQ